MTDKERNLCKIPSKHGRIVDLDRVLDWLINEDGRFSMAMCAKIDNALKNAPVILEASNKAETPRKARICPHYQGVCGLDEDIVCYCSSHYEMCDKFNELKELIDEPKWHTGKPTKIGTYLVCLQSCENCLKNYQTAVYDGQKFVLILELIGALGKADVTKNVIAWQKMGPYKEEE